MESSTWTVIASSFVNLPTGVGIWLVIKNKHEQRRSLLFDTKHPDFPKISVLVSGDTIEAQTQGTSYQNETNAACFSSPEYQKSTGCVKFRLISGPEIAK